MQHRRDKLRNQTSLSITKVVQNVSEDIAVSIYEHRLAWILVPGVGHEFSKHRLGISMMRIRETSKCLPLTLHLTISVAPGMVGREFLCVEIKMWREAKRGENHVGTSFRFIFIKINHGKTDNILCGLVVVFS